MAKQKNRAVKSPATPSPFEEARDELFQHIMSLVGPRPLLMEYLPRYSPRQAKRHAVRPGITGLAQVNGRNELAWEERFEFDLFYAEHISVWLDLRILARTVWLVIAGRGISQPGQATAQEFRGAEGQ